MRREELSLSIGALVVFWGVALAVALNDIDFFSFQDLFDTTRLHHEHIVATLVLAGIVAALLPLIWRNRRRTPPDGGRDAEPRSD